MPAVQDRFVYEVSLAEIAPSPHNPRQRLEGLDELAESIQSYGLLQPIVVRRVRAGYELVAGHRRLAAVQQLGWSKVLATVRDDDENAAYILTLVENLQREDLTPKEEASALEILVRERQWSTRQVGEAIKRSPMYVSKRLRVFEDPVLARPALDNQMPVSTAEGSCSACLTTNANRWFSRRSMSGGASLRRGRRCVTVKLLYRQVSHPLTWLVVCVRWQMNLPSSVRRHSPRANSARCVTWLRC